eukprot:1325697-Pyramimonas_sp.AAC.1
MVQEPICTNTRGVTPALGTATSCTTTTTTTSTARSQWSVRLRLCGPPLPTRGISPTSPARGSIAGQLD